MNYLESTNFFKQIQPQTLTDRYGSPVFVYNEDILRQRCRDMKNLVEYPNFIVNYSAKANSNLALLKIIREEGLQVDAMSPGEIYVNLQAGFPPGRILYICNNVSGEEMKFAIERGVKVSIDSVSQLKLYGQLNPGGEVVLRFNAGIGAGHSDKVKTAGKNTKFGIDPDHIDEVFSVLQTYSLKVIGINQHIGSLFLEGTPYLEGSKSLLTIAEQFENLHFVDLGGGFGVPYNQKDGEKPLDLQSLGKKLNRMMYDFVKQYGKDVAFKIEPGRYITAECGVLLGTVHATKTNYGKKYIGTDLGFNVLSRPVMYDSYHEIEIFTKGNKEKNNEEVATVVGNICETGDILARDRNLPTSAEGDIIAVLNAGAYGFCMSSNYNNRLRPAEALINSAGKDKLIRKRENLEDLVRHFEL